MILAWTRLQQGARAFVPREQGALLAQRVLHAEAIIASYDLSVMGWSTSSDAVEQLIAQDSHYFQIVNSIFGGIFSYLCGFHF